MTTYTTPAPSADAAPVGVRFYTVPGPDGTPRWVFAGCRQPAGYATQTDAELELRAQQRNLYVGQHNTGPVDRRTHRTNARTLSALAARR